MKKIVYVISVDTCFDCDQHVVIEKTAYDNIEDARKRIRQIYKNEIKGWDEDDPDLVVERWEDEFQIYNDGTYPENHSCAKICEVSVNIGDTKNE